MNSTSQFPNVPDEYASFTLPEIPSEIANLKIDTVSAVLCDHEGNQIVKGKGAIYEDDSGGVFWPENVNVDFTSAAKYRALQTSYEISSGKFNSEWRVFLFSGSKS